MVSQINILVDIPNINVEKSEVNEKGESYNLGRKYNGGNGL